VKSSVAVICFGVVAGSVDSIRVVGNAVGLSAWDRTVVGVVGIYRVEGGIIVSEDNISQGSIAIRDNEIGDGSSVRNEFSSDSRSGQSIFSIGAWWCPRRKDRQRENQKSEKCLNHIEKVATTLAILAPRELFI
jgi:hypothetical protein